MFEINLGNLVEVLGKEIDDLTEEIQASVELGIRGIAEAAKAKAFEMADERLHTTKVDYQQALDLEEIDSKTFLLSLRGEHANQIEDGWNSFDEKPGLLAGKNAKVSKKGIKYNTVPFYYEPSGKSPIVNPRNTDMTLTRFQREIVSQIAKQNKIKSVLKNKSGSPLQGVVARIKNTGFKRFDGLTKIQKTYGKTTQSTFMTFRRVSQNSDPSKWIHPGYSGAKIWPTLEVWTEFQVVKMLDELLKNK